MLPLGSSPSGMPRKSRQTRDDLARIKADIAKGKYLPRTLRVPCARRVAGVAPEKWIPSGPYI